MALRTGLTLVLALLSASLAVSAAYASDLLVIASQDPALPPGATLPADRRLVLAPDVEVTLVSASGAVTTLRGPFDAVPPRGGTGDHAGAGSGLLGSLSKLLDKREEQRSRLAVFRAGGAHRPGRPDIWGIDVRRAERFCLRRGFEPVLWRSGRKPARTLVLARAMTPPASARIDWPAGESTLAWPGSVPVEDGAHYTLGSDGAAPREFELRLIPALPTDTHRAVWMADHGCEYQASRVLDLLVGG